YLRRQLNLPDDAPLNLLSLRCPLGGDKPPIPLPTLMKLAIYASQDKRLTREGIFLALIGQFQWFRDHQYEFAWKASFVDYNLAVSKPFKRVHRPQEELGADIYWVLDVSGGEGYKRPRKRPNQRVGKVIEDEVSDGPSLHEVSPLDNHRA
ncbi:hypothetical protein C8R43DRAFT_888021, partial [Mycena crocata]